MIRTRRARPLRARRSVVLASVAAALAAGGGACSSTTDPSSIAGTYRATTLRVTPTGQGVIDVLAAGGTMSLTIASNNATTGTLSVPASVNDGVPFTVSLAGTAVRSGNTVQFQPSSSDSFVRDLTFTVNGNTLQTTNQVISGASFTVTLTRQ